MEDMHKAGMVPGNRLELPDAIEFPLERAVEFKILAADDFDGAHGSRDAAGEPDFAVTAPTDAAQDFVVRNARRFGSFGDELR
jgi:hypothetical protein